MFTLSEEDFISRTPYGDVVIGCAGDYWNDGSTTIILSGSSLVPYLIDHDNWVELDDEGMFPNKTV